MLIAYPCHQFSHPVVSETGGYFTKCAWSYLLLFLACYCRVSCHVKTGTNDFFQVEICDSKFGKGQGGHQTNVMS